MLNAISGQNLPVLNFAYHLPKQWTDQYANVDGKQPKFFLSLSYTALYFYKIKVVPQYFHPLACSRRVDALY